MKQLITKWQAFIDMGVRPKEKNYETRSRIPAFHFGVWRCYRKIPIIASDTNSDNYDVQAASDAFLTLLRNCMTSKIATFTESKVGIKSRACLRHDSFHRPLCHSFIVINNNLADFPLPAYVPNNLYSY